MKTNLYLIAAVVIGASQPVVAQTKISDATAIQVGPGEAMYTSTERKEATVTKINYKTRVVVLRAADGDVVTLTAGPGIKNLASIKVGDKIVANVEELVKIKLIKGGKQPIGHHAANTEQMGTTGTVPSANATRTEVFTANVTKVDKKTATVTLQGAQASMDLTIQDPKQLKLVKVGDQVEATVTQTLALSVEPVAAKSK